MQDVLILVGTVTGNAEQVASELETVFEYMGTPTITLDMSDATPDVLQQHPDMVLCISTYGSGELPTKAEPFYNAIQKAAPDLQHNRFAVCALGDHGYDPYFCEAGLLFEELFTELGATEIVERFEIDGDLDDFQIEHAQAWAMDVAEIFQGVAVAA